MKTKSYFILFTGLFTIFAMVFQNCKKDEDNQAPSCEITAPSNGEECILDEIVTISANAADSDGSITFVKFIIDKVEVASVGNLPYKYDWNTSGESIGSHVINVTCLDNDGASSSDEITVEIVIGEAVFFTATPTSGNAPLKVNFTDQSTNNPTSWEWDFGDGNGSTEQNPSHTYNNMGSYDVSLTTTNADGSDTEIKTSYIVVKGTITDPRDDQTYSIVTIGTQTWFAENLNYETTDSWWFDDNEANGELYGRLYTWDAAFIACPAGWHLPSDNEWKILEMYLGMSQDEANGIEERGTDEGKKLKSTSSWSNEGNGTDILGFTALAAGSRHSGGQFGYLGSGGNWWTNTEEPPNGGWHRYLENTHDRIGRTAYNKQFGFSVRCIKDD
jgi:uncharacterized protein (TIGR02145 family)